MISASPGFASAERTPWDRPHRTVCSERKADAKAGAKPPMGPEETQSQGERGKAGGTGSERRDGSSGRRRAKLEQELGALGRAGEMTAEIGTAAKRSEQRGPAAAQRLKEGTGDRQEPTRQRSLGFAGARDARASGRRAPWIRAGCGSFRNDSQRRRDGRCPNSRP